MEAAAVYPDWSALPFDLTATLMLALDIPDLVRAGAVCTTWHAAYSAARRARVPAAASSCLLYSSGADAADGHDLQPLRRGGLQGPPPCPRVPQPLRGGLGPWLGGRQCTGLVVAADEASNLQAFNPLTGAAADLLPGATLFNVEPSSDDRGRLVYRFQFPNPDYSDVFTPRQLRLHLYYQVHLSCTPSAGSDCVVLLVHKSNGELSFARIGDERWTRLSTHSGYRTAAYNEKDGLFYVLSVYGSLCAFDLSGPEPVLAKQIIQEDPQWGDPPSSYIVFAPWGDILLVSRYMSMFAGWTLLCKCLPSTWRTSLMSLWIHLRDHVLFLGFGSAIMLSNKDYPRFKPNRAYLADDNCEQIIGNMYSRREVGIWNFETQELERWTSPG
ncbi:hypothetical protein ACP4OV_027252 [Aristida adscensionis]